MAYKQTTQSTGMLNKEQHHSTKSADKSKHYHAKIIGEPRPNNQGGLNAVKTRMEYQSLRPGLTAQTNQTNQMVQKSH